PPRLLPSICNSSASRFLPPSPNRIHCHGGAAHFAAAPLPFLRGSTGCPSQSSPSASKKPPSACTATCPATSASYPKSPLRVRWSRETLSCSSAESNARCCSVPQRPPHSDCSESHFHTHRHVADR